MVNINLIDNYRDDGGRDFYLIGNEQVAVIYPSVSRLGVRPTVILKVRGFTRNAFYCYRKVTPRSRPYHN